MATPSGTVVEQGPESSSSEQPRKIVRLGNGTPVSSDELLRRSARSSERFREFVSAVEETPTAVAVVIRAVRQLRGKRSVPDE